MPEVTPDQVREHVERIAASEVFLQSDRLCRFLRFTVEAKLRGEAAQIKEYLLGREVFDRNGEYDPRTDPIVRVEARRLRRKLEEYYAGPGAGDAVRIDYPKGSYAPEFERVGGTDRATPGKRWVAVVGFALALVIAVLILLRFQPRDPNMVAVVPARWVWKNEAFPATPRDVDLAERVAAELARRNMPVVAWPAMQRYGVGEWTNLRIARESGAGRTLIVSVREEAEGLRVTAFLVDGRTERKLHVADQTGVRLDSPAEKDALARLIAQGIAAQ